jgi:hypothetical protein
VKVTIQVSAVAAVVLIATCSHTNARVHASDAFGLSLDRPVEVCWPRGERDYLQRLTCNKGDVSFRRLGAAGARNEPRTEEEERLAEDQMREGRHLAPGEVDFHVVDVYEVTCGTKTVEVYIDMYHCNQPQPSEAIPGFTLLPVRE